jgi:hypothetical protein
MGLLDILGLSGQGQFKKLLKDFVDEATARKPDSYSDAPYAKLDNFKIVSDLNESDKESFIPFLTSEIKSDWKKNLHNGSYRSGPWYHGLKLIENLAKHSDLSLSALESLAHSLKKLRDAEMSLYILPTMTVLEAIQKAVRKDGASPSMKKALLPLVHESGDYIQSEQAKENDLIFFLLQDDSTLEVAEHDRWGKTVLQYLRECSPDLRNAWIALFAHAKTGAGKSTPSAKWLKLAEPLLDKVGHEVFAEKLITWLQFLQELLREIHTKKSKDFLREENHDIVKGLIWCAGLVNDPKLNAALDDYAAWAYKKMAGVGSLSVKTGTAAMFAFSMLPVKEGVSRLSKFRTKIKNNSILKSIDKIIKTVSEKNGLGISEMEEMAVPDFGIKEGKMSTVFSDCAGIYSFETGEILWERSGKTQKSIPADIKTTYASGIKTFKNAIKEAEEMVPVIKSRLEQGYLQQREWDFSSWKNLYIEHPLSSLIGKKLIWHFNNGVQKDQGMFLGDSFVNSREEKITWLSESTKVQLWHPIGFESSEILQWRNFLRSKNIVQPFKQAYREIYIITDAELRTETYSNRFAAHILRQHQFAALLRQRGWHYTLMGNWDSHNTPYLRLPKWDLIAEYFVNAEWDQSEANVNASGIFNYVTTDQVRFTRGTQPVPLLEVPALVFSEVMRDVDLFVGVTSIGNDAAWMDGGDTFQNAYWREYSFRDLSESANIRSQVLQSLVPSLKIADLCSFDKKFLIVKGKLKTYKIHMGSGNILMEPDDKYLCIVPEGRKLNPNGEKVFLPFEGDTLLSIIISKAFLLAEDDKIKDVTITRQIR